MTQYPGANYTFCLYLLPVWSEKIAKCLRKLPKNYFTGNMTDCDAFTRIAINVGDLGKLIVAKGFRNLPKIQ